jgi:hypothetical protein
MAKKQLTRTLDTSTAEGQEQALRLLQEASKLTVAMPAPVAPPIPEPALMSEAIVEEKTEVPVQNVAPKKTVKPKIEKRGRPAKGDPNEGGSVKLIADGSSVKRINMDFPLDIYERIESEIDDTGQTVKGFFLMLSKQYFKNRNNTPSV